jgi:hypothetical protein
VVFLAARKLYAMETPPSRRREKAHVYKLWLISSAPDAQVEEKHVALRPRHLSCGILVPDPRLRHGVDVRISAECSRRAREHRNRRTVSGRARAFAGVLRDTTGDGEAAGCKIIRLIRFCTAGPDCGGQPHQQPFRCSVSDPPRELILRLQSIHPLPTWHAKRRKWRWRSRLCWYAGFQVCAEAFVRCSTGTCNGQCAICGTRSATSALLPKLGKRDVRKEGMNPGRGFASYQRDESKVSLPCLRSSKVVPPWRSKVQIAKNRPRQCFGGHEARRSGCRWTP